MLKTENGETIKIFDNIIDTYNSTRDGIKDINSLILISIKNCIKAFKEKYGYDIKIIECDTKLLGFITVEGETGFYDDTYIFKIECLNKQIVCIKNVQSEIDKRIELYKQEISILTEKNRVLNKSFFISKKKRYDAIEDIKKHIVFNTGVSELFRNKNDMSLDVTYEFFKILNESENFKGDIEFTRIFQELHDIDHAAILNIENHTVKECKQIEE